MSFLRRLSTRRVLGGIAIGFSGSLAYSYYFSSRTQDSWEDHVVKPHGSLTRLGERLYMVQGHLHTNPDLRTMVVYRLPDKKGGLLIHSAMALEEPAMSQLESLGQPRILVVPNTVHRLDAGVYKQRYPELVVLCPEGARRQVEKKVAVDATCEEYFARDKGLGVVLHSPKWWFPFGELVYELSLNDKQKAFVFCDLIFNLRLNMIKLWMNKQYFRFCGVHPSESENPRLSVSALVKLMIGNRNMKEFLSGLAERADALAKDGQEVSVLSMAHGDPVKSRCAEQLRRLADSL